MPRILDFKISEFEVKNLDQITEEPGEVLDHVRRYEELDQSLKELEEIEMECARRNWGGEDENPISKETINKVKELLVRSAYLPFEIRLPIVTPTSFGLIEMEWYKEKGHRFAIRINGRGVFFFSGLFGQKPIDESGNMIEEDIHGTGLFIEDQIPEVIREQLSRLYSISIN